MTTLADINVLFPILFADHSCHPAAWSWWEQQADDTVVLCLLTRVGTLRMLTNRTAMGGHPVAPDRALAAWDCLAADPRCRWVEPAAGHETLFRGFVQSSPPTPNLWSDAWLAALATGNGLRLTSFDAGFRSIGLTHFEHLQPAAPP